MRKIFLLVASFLLLSSYSVFAGGGRLCDTSTEACPNLVITVEKTSILETQQVAMNWKSTNGVACMIGNELKTSGTAVRNMNSSGNVYFYCSNALGGRVSSNGIYINVTPVEITGELTVSETSILEGESVNVSWDIQNAQSCWMNGQSVAVKKSYTEKPLTGK